MKAKKNTKSTFFLVRFVIIERTHYANVSTFQYLSKFQKVTDKLCVTVRHVYKRRSESSETFIRLVSLEEQASKALNALT